VVAVAALAALYLGVAFVLSRFLDPEELAGWLEPRLEAALSRDVEVGRVEVGFLPLGVRLQDLILADPTGLAPELARVQSLHLRVAILPLLRREIRVSRLAVEGFQADLRLSEDGRANFGDLSTRPLDKTGLGGPEMEEKSPSQEEAPGPSEGPTGGRPPFTLDLRGLRLADGQIRYADARTALEVEVTELQLRATARRDPEGGLVFVGSTDGGVTLRRGEALPLLEDVHLELTFDVETDGRFERLKIRTGELRLGGIALALTGEVDHLQDPVRSLSLALTGVDLPLRDLMAVLPDSVRERIPVEADGFLAASLRVEGEAGPGHTPTVTGEVGLTQGQITLEGNRIAEGLTAHLDLSPDRWIQLRTQATVLGGPLSLEGTATLEGEPGLDMVLRATSDLGRLGSIVDLAEGVTARGEIRSEFRIVGPLGDLSDLRFRGNVLVTGLRATHPALGVPLGIPQGDVELNGIRAILRELPIELGEDRLVLSGDLSDPLAFLIPGKTPRFEGALRGPRLDLSKFRTIPLPDSSLTYGKVAFAKVGGRPVGGRAIQDAAKELGLSRPDSLPMAGRLEVSLDTVIDHRGRMEDLRARVDFGPSFLQIAEATFRRYGGEVRTSVDLTLAPDESTPFSLSLQLHDLDAGEFLAETTPLGRFVRGTISVDLDLIGTLDGFLLPDRPALIGSGSFSLTGGGLATAPLTRSLSEFLGMESLREPSIQDWASSFVLEEGSVRLAEATIQGAPGSPIVGGTVGLDGKLDLRTVFDLPTERLNSSALERLGFAGEIAANVAQRPDVVQAILKIGGSVFDPSVEADPASAARAVGQAVEEEVRSEVQDRVDAQKAEAQRRIQEQKEELQNRAAGFLRSLVRLQDAADTVRADSLLPDTLPPDTVPPDSVRPDTVPPDTLTHSKML
jgi:hypothetical protein